jgi:hypothetical protein
MGEKMTDWAYFVIATLHVDVAKPSPFAISAAVMGTDLRQQPNDEIGRDADAVADGFSASMRDHHEGGLQSDR